MEDLPTRARVLIIGGGVVGCSILYHLAKKGWKDLLLLERQELSCGSSWHAAGQFHIINSNANLSALQLHTLKFYPQLQEESGQSIGLHRTGGIYLASSAERFNYLIQEQAKNRAQNPEMQFINLEEAKHKHPLIAPRHFVGALYDPLDGHIDPAGVVQAFAKAARNLGAQVQQHTKVESLRQNAIGEWQANTNRGTVHADIVINAGGLWAREVGRMSGIELPVQAMEHHYLITEPIADIENLGRELPAMVDFDGNAYGRQEGMGMLLGTYEENGTPWSLDTTPWDFGHELLPDDLARIAPRLEVAFQHFPQLANAGIKKVVNGPFTFAPDGNALIGPIPGVRNLWTACGVMAGFCQGAGIGKVFADWMCDGEPGMDIFAMDVARFGAFAGRKYTALKVQENFGRRFQISYPNEELPALRPWRTTALYERFKNAGAIFGTSFGLEHVLWFAQPGEQETPTFLRSNAFSAVAEEVRAVREKVGYIEVANFAKHAVCGVAAEDFLNQLLACRMPAAGRLRLAPMLSPNGNLLGDLSVAKMADDDFLLFGSGAAQLAHTRHFLSHMPKTGVHIANRSAELQGIAIAGPKSRELLQRLTREDVSATAFRFMDIRRMEIGGVAAIVARVSFTGELGYEIYCAPDYLLALHEAINDVGGDLGLRPFGGYALMSMRLEKGFGAWTMDFREDFTPAESGLSDFIHFDNSDFIGKAAAQNTKTPKRRRVTLIIDAAAADALGDEPVYADDKIIGFVTSGGYGHYIDKSLAIAYLDAQYATEGRVCAVEILSDKRPARVCLQPPYDPNGDKMRS